MQTTGGEFNGPLHTEGGIKVQTPSGVIEVEGDEVAIVPEAFDKKCFADSFCEKPAIYKMRGTMKQIASAINQLGGGINFEPGATVHKNGRKLSRPRMTYRNKRRANLKFLAPGTVIINRTNMLNPKIMEFEGTAHEIANAINTYGGNGVSFKKGGKTDERYLAETSQYVHANSPEKAVSKTKKAIESTELEQVEVDHLYKAPFGSAERIKLFENGGPIPAEVIEAQDTINAIGPSLSDATEDMREDYYKAKEVLDKSGYYYDNGKLVKRKESMFHGLNFQYKNPYDLNRAIESFLDENKDRKEFTIDEKKFLLQYSGYGGLKDLGKFSSEELQGILYEYYTPDEIIRKMWGLAYKFGYPHLTGNSVLETSCGIGSFFKYAPQNAEKVGYELNPYSARITKIIFPDVQVKTGNFERNFIVLNESIGAKVDDLQKFGLVIGNPPYGRVGGYYMGMGEDKYSKARTWTEYFILRGLDVTAQGGLLIYVVGTEQYTGGTMFLDDKMTPTKKMIYDRAELVDAYRLPRDLFERTKVSTEILVFKKY
jgi:hypothetical protein